MSGTKRVPRATREWVEQAEAMENEAENAAIDNELAGMPTVGDLVRCASCGQRVQLILGGYAASLETHGPADNPCLGSRSKAIDNSASLALAKTEADHG